MMNFNQTLEKLKNSEEFKKFKEENPKAYLCSGFFVIDYETNNLTKQIDFFLPEKNKMAVFLIEDSINFKIDDILEGTKKEIQEVNLPVKTELESIEKIVKKEAEEKIKKIIAVIQKLEDKQIWNLTCILEGFGMLRLHLDAETGKVIKKEKGSLLDFVKQVK